MPGATAFLPTSELLATWLELPEYFTHDMILSFERLTEEVRRHRLGAPAIRSRLYGIFDRVEAVLPDHPQSLRHWAAVRAELIRTAFAA